MLDYCSRCGKRIYGTCLKCYGEMKDDLARRQAIPPGCPRLSGEAVVVKSPDPQQSKNNR